MALPTLDGVIDRRVLVNYRVDPARLARLLPAGLRPQVAGGAAIGGICLIRLSALRPRGLPHRVGMRSENAAHRFAVEWDAGGGTRSGVYIVRRDTASRAVVALGGRLFPGVHGRARFTVDEPGEDVRIAVRTADGGGDLVVEGRTSDVFPADSALGDLAGASAFFERGAVGVSPGRRGLEAVELETLDWTVAPLRLDRLDSAYFGREDGQLGRCEIDNALVMRGVRHRWHARAAPVRR